MGHPARPSQMIAEMSDDQMDPFGSAIDASMNGRRMNGHTMNSHSMNGHSMNGHSMNGHSMNGHSMNGHATNGYATNGHIMDGHGMTNPAPAASSSAPSSGSDADSDRSDPDGDESSSDSDESDSNSDGSVPNRNVSAPVASGSIPAVTVPPVSSLNPTAHSFVPHHGANRAIRAIIADRMNSEPASGRAVNNLWGNDEMNDAWVMVWPPISRDEWASNDIQAFVRITVHIILHLAIAPVLRSELAEEGGLLGVNPVLTFPPRQPIPLAFLRAEYLAAQIIAPLGMYWYLLTQVFHVTNQRLFQHPDRYRAHLNNLVWLVHSPRNEHEIFILVHCTMWLRYHRRLFDELIASADRRRATMMSPDAFLTAERVYYVDQRAYVDEIIRQLERWLLFAHHTHACPFCRAMIWVGLNGHVVEDSLQSLVRHYQGDGPGEGYDRQGGPGDVWPGNNKAPGDEEHPESAASGGLGQAESQPSGGPAEDVLEGGAHAARRWEAACGGGRGESSSQSADVEAGPRKGKQVALPQRLRELSADGGTHVVLEETARWKAVFDCFSNSVVTPNKTTAAVSRTHAHAYADKGRLSDAETMLARLRG